MKNTSQGISDYIVFAQRIGLSGVAQAIFSLRGLITLPILFKTLGDSDYGIWAIILSTLVFLQPLVQLGLGNSIVRFLSSKDKSEIIQGVATVLVVTAITGTIVSLLLFVAANSLASLIGNDYAEAFKIAPPLILLDSLGVIALGSLRVFGLIKKYAFMRIIQTVLEIGLIAVFVLIGNDLIWAVIALLITKCLTLLITLYIIISHAGFARPDFSPLRPFMVYGIPLIPTALFETILDVGDRYLIAYYEDEASVGVYSAAYGVGFITSMFVSYFTYILAPTMFNLYDKGQVEEVKPYVAYTWKYMLMISLPSAFGLSILAEPLLTNLTTAESAADGRYIVPFVAFAGVSWGVYAVLAQVYRLSKKTNIFAVSSAIAAIMNIGLNVIFIPLWGIIGAAIATAITYVVNVIIIGYYSRKFMKFDLSYSFIFKSILASSVMAAVIWAIDVTSSIEILLSALAGAVIYFVLLFLFRTFSSNEIQLMRTILTVSISEVRRNWKTILTRVR